MKALFVHGGVLALAAALSLHVWSEDGEIKTGNDSTAVEVWGGKPDALESIVFESKSRKVRVEPKKDAVGRWFVVSVDKEKGRSPHAHGDAGAEAAPAEREALRFVSVKGGSGLAEKLAPLTALRAVGKIEGARNEEFGLAEPEGTVKVKMGGREHSLLIGAGTPGGQERYAKHVETGTVYAVPADIAQNLLFAESRLLERDLHGFTDAEITRIRISKAGKSREGVRLLDKKEGYADASNPGKLEETIGNFMTKVGRLRATEFVEAPASPIRPEDAILRVDYFADGKALGFFQLFAVPGEKGDEYLGQTEHTRWYVKLPASSADQLAQDVGGVLK